MISTKLLDFKNSTPSTVVSNDDGSYTIFINSRLSYEMQQEVYKHEINHILNGDFDKYNADMIELYAHM